MGKDQDFRKSLKSPDSFQKTVAGVVEWVYLNRGFVFGSLAAVVAIFVAVYGWQYATKKQVLERQERLAEIDDLYAEEDTAVQKSRDKLNAELAAIKNEKDPARAEVQKKLDALKADHSVSTAKYQAFYNAHANTIEGWIAGIRYSVQLLADNKKEEAKAVLTEILEKSKPHDFFQMQAGFMLTNLLVDLKDFDAALQQVDNLIARASDGLKPQAYLLRANVLLVKGDKESAVQALDVLIKDHATTTEAAKAKSIKALIAQ